MKKPNIVEGDMFTIPYPFVRENYAEQDEEGYAESPTWRPGVRMVKASYDHVDAIADGTGEQILHVIGKYKPTGFPERIFYTRKWKDPDGKVFGKNACRIVSVSAFRSIIGGYRHEFTLAVSGAEVRA